MALRFARRLLSLQRELQLHLRLSLRLPRRALRLNLPRRLGHRFHARLQTPLVGINNRNLRTFEVSLQTTLDLKKEVPAARLLVAESGILAPVDVHTLRDAGVNAFLVGEAFMRAPDPGRALAQLFS